MRFLLQSQCFCLIAVLTYYILKVSNRIHPHCYGTGKFHQGQILLSTNTFEKKYNLGSFNIHFNEQKKIIYVKHVDDSEKVLWSSVEYLPFISGMRYTPILHLKLYSTPYPLAKYNIITFLTMIV